jgi:hypothetical protein
MQGAALHMDPEENENQFKTISSSLNKTISRQQGRGRNAKLSISANGKIVSSANLIDREASGSFMKLRAAAHTPSAYAAFDDQREALNHSSTDGAYHQHITNEVLKVCNVVREKNYGSKLLHKKTGVAGGARTGADQVHEPLLVSNTAKRRRLAQSAAFRSRHHLSQSQGGSYTSMSKPSISKHRKVLTNVAQMKDGTYKAVNTHILANAGSRQDPNQNS